MPSFLQGSTLVISAIIKRDLGMTTAQLTWMTSASALTTGSFLLFFGKVADMFGRRGILLANIFLFAVTSLATGFSRNAIVLDILNGIMGLVSAATIPAAQGMLGSIYDKPSKRKNYAFACFSSGNHLGFVFSSIFSGIATQFFGWAASFWLLAITYLLVGIVACFTVPIDEGEKLPLTLEVLKQFDIVGAALTIGGIGLFIAGISVGPDAPQGWKTPYIIVFIVLGFLMLVCFVWWENRFAHPLMPMNIWRDREFSLLLVILLLGYLSFPALFFFAALYLQELFHYSALITAVCLLPAAVSGVIVNIIAGRILHRVSNKLLMGIGAAAFMVSFIFAAVQRSGSSYWAFTFPALCIVVVGTDLEFNVVNMYVVSALPNAQQSIASSVFQTTIKLAVTIGLGAFAAIFASVSEKPATTGYYVNDPFEPYAALFWFATALSFISLLLVPFLRIKTQGNA
ncbi:aminotriazole resistance protein [Pochonia chlamydosporia 170]|uniref:Aminotriazole resistance protein n=1 Tax=Pochonia chlamydosporia 170 TaxID=1380566 RepID=A0A179F717_METCM|nr:aminotriazole resistance protein [Pochonia chlamydosporia 170]OAQ61202.1 aminotriazole resistance protein [Pochonia chlamydosporia 170]